MDWWGSELERSEGPGGDLGLDSLKVLALCSEQFVCGQRGVIGRVQCRDRPVNLMNDARLQSEEARRRFRPPRRSLCDRSRVSIEDRQLDGHTDELVVLP